MYDKLHTTFSQVLFLDSKCIRYYSESDSKKDQVFFSVFVTQKIIVFHRHLQSCGPLIFRFMYVWKYYRKSWVAESKNESQHEAKWKNSVFCEKGTTNGRLIRTKKNVGCFLNAKPFNKRIFQMVYIQQHLATRDTNF